MPLTNPEINQLKQAYRQDLAAAQAANAGFATEIGDAPPNGFVVTWSATDAQGVPVVMPIPSFTSQNMTFDEAVVAYRDLRRSGQI